MSHKILTGLGTAAGGFVAAGLISLATGPVAHACSAEDPTTLCDPNLLSSPLLDIGGYTNQSFADPTDNEFVETLFTGPNFTDVLTSGSDPGLDAGVAGETVNTFIDPSDPALDPMLSFTLPFTDPLAQLFTDLLPLGF
jgi:hypothetical protein